MSCLTRPDDRPPNMHSRRAQPTERLGRWRRSRIHSWVTSAPSCEASKAPLTHGSRRARPATRTAGGLLIVTNDQASIALQAHGLAARHGCLTAQRRQRWLRCPPMKPAHTDEGMDTRADHVKVQLHLRRCLLSLCALRRRVATLVGADQYPTSWSRYFFSPSRSSLYVWSRGATCSTAPASSRTPYG